MHVPATLGFTRSDKSIVFKFLKSITVKDILLGWGYNSVTQVPAWQSREFNLWYQRGKEGHIAIIALKILSLTLNTYSSALASLLKQVWKSSLITRCDQEYSLYSR